MQKDLIRRIQSGDKNAFKNLYIIYKEPALCYCNTILKDKDEAQNIIQEVFITLWDKREKINPELTFNSYLFSIIRNRVYGHLKNIKKDEDAKETYRYNIMTHQKPESELKEKRLHKIREAIIKLTDKRRKILELNYEEGKSYEEIAAIMKISKNTVKNQLVTAKQFIRAQLNVASA